MQKLWQESCLIFVLQKSVETGLLCIQTAAKSVQRITFIPVDIYMSSIHFFFFCKNHEYIWNQKKAGDKYKQKHKYGTEWQEKVYIVERQSWGL